MTALNLVEGDTVLARQDKGSAELQVKLDNHVAMGCVRVTAAHEGSIGLGDLMGDITIEKIMVSKVSVDNTAIDTETTV